MAENIRETVARCISEDREADQQPVEEAEQVNEGPRHVRTITKFAQMAIEAAKKYDWDGVRNACKQMTDSANRAWQAEQ